MLRIALPAVMLLAGCQLPGFADATQDVNNEFALAVQMRDRCSATADVDHCLAWRQFQESRPILAWQYEQALSRWERLGPY